MCTLKLSINRPNIRTLLMSRTVVKLHATALKCSGSKLHCLPAAEADMLPRISIQRLNRLPALVVNTYVLAHHTYERAACRM